MDATSKGSLKSMIYKTTGGSAAELTDLIDYRDFGLNYTQATNLVSRLHGYLLVDRTILDLFAAQLAAEVAAGNAPEHLYRQFVENFGGDLRTFVGD